MGWWDYKNIGADAAPENVEYIEKIFEYIGFETVPADMVAMLIRRVVAKRFFLLIRSRLRSSAVWLPPRLICAACKKKRMLCL